MFMNGDPSSKKPLLYYVLVAMTIILLMNAFIFPALLARQVQEVGYSDFLSWVDSGRVTQVSLDQESDQIIFVARDDNSQEQIYKTAVFPDDGLRARLEAAGVQFSAQIPTQNNPRLSFIISWILPIALFSLLGRVFMGQMDKHMGGGLNVMNFGKSKKI